MNDPWGKTKPEEDDGPWGKGPVRKSVQLSISPSNRESLQKIKPGSQVKLIPQQNNSAKVVYIDNPFSGPIEIVLGTIDLSEFASLPTTAHISNVSKTGGTISFDITI
jgi:hypothetical protein